MQSKLLSTLKLILGWPLSAVALFFLGRMIVENYSSVQSQISSISIFPLAVGIVCFIAYYLLRSYIWHKILSEKGYSLSIKKSASLWATSELKRYVPGNIWSFLSRATQFAGEGVSKKDIAAALIYEVQLIVLSSLLVSIFLASHVLVDWYIPNNNLPLKLGVYCGALLIILIFINSSILFRKISGKLFLGFSPQKNFNFLLLYMIAFVLFGLGNYFSVVSVTFLNPGLIKEYMGFFVLSLLLGYLSFITPMGLGAREKSV